MSLGGSEHQVTRLVHAQLPFGDGGKYRLVGVELLLVSLEQLRNTNTYEDSTYTDT